MKLFVNSFKTKGAEQGKKKYVDSPTGFSFVGTNISKLR